MKQVRQLDEGRVREILEQYHSPLPAGIEAKVLKYIELMTFWGAKMSLTALKEPEEIVRFHFGESIFALSVGMCSKSRLADVGTGAGFPGLALKLAEPSLSLVLVEPNKKKCAFLHEVLRALALEGVKIIASGYEDSSIEEKSLSAITVRALKADEALLQWGKAVLGQSGQIWMWLGHADLVRIRAQHGWKWGEATLIPGTDGRYIISGSPDH